MTTEQQQNAAPGAELLLEVKDLKTYYPIRKGLFRKVVGHVKAVDGVNFMLRKGDTLGLVGESGCGKTTTGRTLIRLLDPTAGTIRFNDPDLGWVNLDSMTRKELAPIRKNIQMIFQDPFSSLNPRLTVGRIVGEPLVINKVAYGRRSSTNASPNCCAWSGCGRSI